MIRTANTLQTNLKKYNRQKGFTLIELLIVITIFGILFSTGYRSYLQYVQKQFLLKQARSVENLIKKASTYASTGKKTTACTTFLDGYRINWDSLNSKFDLNEVCSNANVSVADSVTIDTTSHSVSITSNPIMYKTLGQGTNLAADSVITITQIQSSRSITITIKRTGEVVASY